MSEIARILSGVLLFGIIGTTLIYAVISKPFRQDFFWIIKEYLIFKPLLQWFWKVYGRIIFIDRKGNLLDNSLTTSVETGQKMNDEGKVKLFFSDSIALLLSNRPNLKNLLEYRPENFPRWTELNCILDINFWGPKRGVHMIHVFIVQDDNLAAMLSPRKQTKKQRIRHALLEEIIYGPEEEEIKEASDEEIISFPPEDIIGGETVTIGSTPSRVIIEGEEIGEAAPSPDQELLKMASEDQIAAERIRRQAEIVTMEILVDYQKKKSPVLSLLEENEN